MTKEKKGSMLTIKEVSERLRVSERTVRRWIKNGKLKSSKPGHKYLIPENEVMKLLHYEDVATEEKTNTDGAFHAPFTHEELEEMLKEQTNRSNPDTDNAIIQLLASTLKDSELPTKYKEILKQQVLTLIGLIRDLSQPSE